MVLDDGQMGIYIGEKYMILSFDPGRDKIGFAFVDMNGDLILSGIFQADELENFCDNINKSSTENHNNISIFTTTFTTTKNINFSLSSLKIFVIEGKLESLPENIIDAIKFIAIGNGTNSKKFHERIKNKFSIEIKIIDEKNTTLEASNLYWKIHNPGFFMKLIPESLRVPNRILDDLAAWSIALRALKKYRDINNNKL